VVVARVKAIRFPDGRVEFEGTPEEVGQALLQMPMLALPKARERDPELPPTIEARILEVLQARAGTLVSTAEVVAALPDVPGRSLRTTLGRMGKTGVVHRKHRGLYGV
jgi:hypothetical protein